ncbi:hypothetical protein ACPV5O_26515 [Vibrio maritimus]|jgi:hypothetical protein|uniref:hypothetical protein n=1 Tax=Vibrio maritimus TaxID=990268 RepID=UPI0040677C30
MIEQDLFALVAELKELETKLQQWQTQRPEYAVQYAAQYTGVCHARVNLEIILERYVKRPITIDSQPLPSKEKLNLHLNPKP